MKTAILIACMLVSTKQRVYIRRNNLLVMLSQLKRFSYFMTNLNNYSDVYIYCNFNTIIIILCIKHKPSKYYSYNVVYS